ncbi:MAG: UDP-2,3-diacylglucosamine diphosphatase LpxI [Pseudotabrizicola sp.]|uniref:LpxI family protein n=1 Tax=Pseudotabrizicola sp. TaxID=2939647 RepID=UPI00271DC67A|nr:UDP-2,3-diacylglucosamine diphosphatase LpxI [Pseudotabrizicola sp.]MDO9638765.1 UDP-2,3-diacylglucosamine diphosphatase LpxI [Pseudotabrizicola sp.]
MTRTAVIAGSGHLPAAVAAALKAPLICALDGFVPEGLAVDMVFRVERLVPFFHALEDAGVTRVTFAGAVQRPRLDPALFDAGTAGLVPRLMAAMAQGDDATLRAVVLLFEEAGFTVAGTAQIAPDLVPGAGVLCGTLSAADEADATRAAEIVAALGAVDVGQGCVVAQGLCLAVEALPGTDAMLAGVTALPPGLRPAGTRGLFYKAPKPGQDSRVDLPTLGPDTVALVAQAGLGGIAWQAGGVICLDLDAMIAAAADAGLFLWAR